MKLRIALICATTAIFAGCTTAPPISPERTEAARQSCIAWFTHLDAAVRGAAVADAQEARIEGHPHLRANRFIAALARDRTIDDATFARDAWPVMRRLDRAARAAEISNLPDRVLADLGATRGDAAHRGEACAEGALTQLHPDRSAIHVPDDYSDAQRIFGAYALARYPFTEGLQRQLAEVRLAFARPLAPPADGKVVRYAVTGPGPVDVSSWGDFGALLERHQPVFEKEVTRDEDLPGALAWDPIRATPIAQRERPAVYRGVSFTRYRGRTLTQLVYTLWFGARPADGPADLLAGHLDGLIWRVTLDDQGRALIYDTIHPCGCYHYFFPTPRATPKPAPDDEPEWAFVPQVLEAAPTDARIVLRIATRTNYLERVTLVAPDEAERGAISLHVLPQDSLRALPVLNRGVNEIGAATTHSAYGPDGLVPGSERAERFFFWPMGIPSAGQMRQWGRHATAFVGRRHFDDADLFEKRFVLDLHDRKNE